MNGAPAELMRAAAVELACRKTRTQGGADEPAQVLSSFEVKCGVLCDVRIIGKAARFWLPETNLGLVPAAGGCTRLTELVGASKAKRVILFHERLEASDAGEGQRDRSVRE